MKSHEISWIFPKLLPQPAFFILGISISKKINFAPWLVPQATSPRFLEISQCPIKRQPVASFRHSWNPKKGRLDLGKFLRWQKISDIYIYTYIYILLMVNIWYELEIYQYIARIWACRICFCWVKACEQETQRSRWFVQTSFLHLNPSDFWSCYYCETGVKNYEPIGFSARGDQL